MTHQPISRVKGGGILSSISDFGGKILNRAVDLLPVELHIPGYQYCGPGTKLAQRLSRGDPGINKLDSACKEHDIAYSKSGVSTSRAEADRILAERAWQRVTANDASSGEKAAAWTVTNLMKAKSKFGGGLLTRRRRQTRRRQTRQSVSTGAGLYLKPYKTTGKGLQIRRSRTRRSKRGSKRC